MARQVFDLNEDEIRAIHIEACREHLEDLLKAGHSPRNTELVIRSGVPVRILPAQTSSLCGSPAGLMANDH